jgi:hypothetical protein
MDLREYEQHKFAIADLLRQMELAAPDKQQWRDLATPLFTRLAQDMLNDQERGEAVDYVRGKLDATFEQNAPKLFSVSARQALVAKHAHDSQRLEANGILSLEHELVDFLLTQKRSEFLLRMCDRLAACFRGLP